MIDGNKMALKWTVNLKKMAQIDNLTLYINFLIYGSHLIIFLTLKDKGLYYRAHFYHHKELLIKKTII